MKKKQIIAFISALLAVLGCLLSGCGKTEEAEKSVDITVLAVGSADAILVQSGEHAMLIDTGEADDGSAILTALSERGIDRLDILLITHFDRDHVGSAAALARELNIGQVLYPDYIGERGEYHAFMAAIYNHEDKQAVKETMELTLGSAAVSIFPAVRPSVLMNTKDEYDNNMSLVVKLSVGERSFLFCGDIEKQRLKEMMAQDTDWQCDWIKLPHHGGYYKLLKSFLTQYTPAYAVITDSAEEPAADKTLSALKELSVPTFRTAEGTIVTHCDGQTITVSTK